MVGLMSQQAANISAQDRRAIAEYIAGHSLDDVVEASQPPACDSEHGFDPSAIPVSSGWGVDAKNTRFQPQQSGGLSATDVPALEVKWGVCLPQCNQSPF